MKKVWLGAWVLTVASVLPLGTAFAQQFRGEESRFGGERFEDRQREERSRRASDSARASNRESQADDSQSLMGWLSDWWSGEEETGRSEEESGQSVRDRLRSNVQSFIKQHDRNQDGYLARNEVPTSLRTGFERVDRNQDGYLSSSELRERARKTLEGQSPVLLTTVWIIDANQGRADVEDLQEAYKTLRKLDENEDGEITRGELREQMQAVATNMVDRCFQKLDENEDERLSRSEASGTPLAKRFNQFDENQDSRLTRDEIRNAIENPQVATRIRERFESRRGESERR